jgi:uncharacterized protein
MKPAAEGTRATLQALYLEVDAIASHIGCESTAECCKFGMTGREPYVTPPELELVLEALRKSGKNLQKPKGVKKRLSVVDAEKRCPLLGAEDRCMIYASRPLGCRTFFCGRATGALPRKDTQQWVRALTAIAEAHSPADPRARPLTSALSSHGINRG